MAAYLRQRFPARVFVPAITLHAAAAWSTTERAWLAFGVAVGAMTLLFVQFRLWDDLEDADRDRVAHTDRLLPRSSRDPFRILAAVLAIVGVSIFSRRGESLAGFVLLYGAGWAGYRLVRPHVADLVWRYGFLLLKYPAFVCLVAVTVGRPASTSLAAATVAAYVGACLYEAWHHDLRNGLGVLS